MIIANYQIVIPAKAAIRVLREATKKHTPFVLSLSKDGMAGRTHPKGNGI